MGIQAVLNSGAGTGFESGNFAFYNTDDVLVENGFSFFENSVLYPPATFSQRYFVTPTLYAACLLAALVVALAPWLYLSDSTDYVRRQPPEEDPDWPDGLGSSVEQLGIFNRNEQFQSSGSLSMCSAWRYQPRHTHRHQRLNLHQHTGGGPQ